MGLAVDEEKGGLMLTGKQERFVQGILGGLSQSDAYRAAYDTRNMRRETIWTKASQLARQEEVRQRIMELRQRIANDTIMSTRERMEWLTALIRGDGPGNADKLKALDIMNKMDGAYVQKVEAEAQSEITIHIELVDDED